VGFIDRLLCPHRRLVRLAEAEEFEGEFNYGNPKLVVHDYIGGIEVLHMCRDCMALKWIDDFRDGDELFKTKMFDLIKSILCGLRRGHDFAPYADAILETKSGRKVLHRCRNCPRLRWLSSSSTPASVR
jgi:hypothetical protein